MNEKQTAAAAAAEAVAVGVQRALATTHNQALGGRKIHGKNPLKIYFSCSIFAAKGDGGREGQRKKDKQRRLFIINLELCVCKFVKS